jgi:hypothetical protein
MADTTQRGIALSQRQDVSIPGMGLGAAPGVSSRAIPVALPGQPAPDTSAAQSLLRALDVSTGNLDAFGKTFLKEDREEQFKLGQMKQQESQQQFADAQAKGVIPQSANPWFIKGYQNQDGRVQGLDYYNQMQSAYLNSPAKGNDDPAAYEKFSGDFKKGYMAKLPADRSTDWWDGFHQTSTVADERMSREHAENVTRMVVNKQETNTGAEVNVILNSTHDPKAAAGAINELAEKMRLEGMPPEAFGKVVAAQVMAKAKLGDPNFLQVLDHVKAGDGKSGATLASDGKIAMARADVSQWLTDKARSAQQFAWAADNHRYSVEVVRPRAEEAYNHQKTEWDRQSVLWNRADQSRSLLGQIQSITIARPDSAYAETRPLLAKLADVDPHQTEAASAFVKSYISSTETVAASAEAPVANGFRDRIIRAAGNPEAQRDLMLDMNAAMDQKKLNRSTFNDLFVYSRDMANFDPTLLRKVNSPELQEVKAAAKGLLMGKDANPFGQLYGKANDDYLQLVTAINDGAIEYLKKNPGASAAEVRQEALKIKDALLPSMLPNYQGGTLEQLGKKAQTAAEAPPATTLKVPEKPKAGAPAPTDMQKALGKLPQPGKQALVKEAAAAYAKGPQAFQKFLGDMDQQLGRPGITAAIIDESNRPAPTSTNP